MKRYEVQPAAEVVESPAGNWVRYDDAQAAIDQARREERDKRAATFWADHLTETTPINPKLRQ